MATPAWLDTGDNAWQLTAGSLVALQSIPGLAILYAGVVKRKWALHSALMVFYAFGSVLICWVLWAYKASFGKQMLPFVGVPGPIVTMNDELTQALLPTSGITADFPMSTMGETSLYQPSLLLLTLATKSTSSSSSQPSLWSSRPVASLVA
jgi:ammonium transporter, Amt family